MDSIITTVLAGSLVAIMAFCLKGEPGKTYIETEKGFIWYSRASCHLGVLFNNSEVSMLDENGKTIRCKVEMIKITEAEAERRNKAGEYWNE